MWNWVGQRDSSKPETTCSDQKWAKARHTNYSAVILFSCRVDCYLLLLEGKCFSYHLSFASTIYFFSLAAAGQNVIFVHLSDLVLLLM